MCALLPTVVVSVLSYLSGGAPEAVTTSVLWERELTGSGHGYAVGELADLNGDGSPEVLIQLGYRDEPARVFALEALSGKELWSAGFPGRSQAVVADLDGDGSCEAVVACGDSLVSLDGVTGGRIARTRLPEEFDDLAAGPSVRVRATAGTDGSIAAPGSAAGCESAASGSVLCTSGKEHADVLTLFSGRGLTERWSVGAVPGDGPFDRGFTWPAALDTDGDGTDEVLVAENGGLLRCFDANGRPLWQAPLGPCERLDPEGVVSSAPVAAQLVPGGAPELAVGCFAGALVVLETETGEELARTHFGRESHEEHVGNHLIPGFIRKLLRETGEPVNSLTPVDVGGNPGEELVLGCSDGFLYAWALDDEEPLWRLDTRGDVYEPCVVVRSAGTAGPSLLAWDTEGAYLVDARDGSAVPLFVDGGGASTVLARDLDGDGHLEVVRIGPDRARVAVLTTDLEPWEARED